MRRGVKALEESNLKDQLALLVLRVVAEISPCTETSLIAYVSGADCTPESGHTESASQARELICNALLKLKELAFIQLTEEQIAITDEGGACRRCACESPEIRFDAADTDVGSRSFDGTLIAN
jgi:hypothetical protein